MNFILHEVVLQKLKKIVNTNGIVYILRSLIYGENNDKGKYPKVKYGCYAVVTKIKHWYIFTKYTNNYLVILYMMNEAVKFNIFKFVFIYFVTMLIMKGIKN